MYSILEVSPYCFTKKESNMANGLGSGESGMHAIMLEIATASADLADFMKWCAQVYGNDQDELEVFQTTLGAVYSYAKNKNDHEMVVEGSCEDESDTGPSRD